MYTSRLEKLAGSLQASGLDALALNPGASLQYLTGLQFHLMERPVVAIFTPHSQPVIVLPELEMLKVENAGLPLKAFPYPEQPDAWQGVFNAALRSLSLAGGRIGVEPPQMRLLEFGFLQNAAAKADFPDASQVVSRLRICKQAAEVESMRHAVQVAQTALEATLPLVRMGMTEEELAGELVVQLLRHGSQPELSFSPIVSSGPNSANPHASPGSRKLSPGDLLVVDWGARVDGYISDLTRTFAIGEVDEEFTKIARIVLQANEAGRAAGKPGVPCAAVDAAARQVIENAGYGAFFTHRTGHGIGMEGHEDPYMRGDNQQLLEPGMAYTVEPGIYLPGRNGVRIEDNVVVTSTGIDCLSDMPRQLRTIA